MLRNSVRHSFWYRYVDDTFTMFDIKDTAHSPIVFFPICSSASILHSAIQDLRTLLVQNGYPQGIITYNGNDVLNRHQNKPDTPVATVLKKDVIILL